VSPRNYAKLKREAFERAGLKGAGMDAEAMRNVLRHSFASFHLAAFRDAKLTLYLMTKTSLASLNNDYRGRVKSRADAEGFFRIVPACS
jgi:hypothetical protein